MKLSDFFAVHNRVALAFSGGVDSAYLLYAAIQNGAQVCAYFVKSPFQPQFELDDARRLAAQLQADMKVLELDVLCDPQIAGNPQNRCYFCKNRILDTITRQARKDGFSVLLDGTNASDDAADRPGTIALREFSVLSPLRECGLTKGEIRRLSKEAGLFTHDKPAYACLATRIPTGQAITLEKLQVTEQAEAYLFSLGFSDFRIRMDGNTGKIQLRQDQLDLLLQHRSEILATLKQYYSSVVLDLEVRA